MPIIGFANGAPVFDSEDEVETRAIVHDPHSGQFTNGGGSGGASGKGGSSPKAPSIIPKLDSVHHSGFGGSAHTAEGMAEKHAAAGNHAHAAAYYLEAATIKGSNGQSYAKQNKLYHTHAALAYKAAAEKATNPDHAQIYRTKATKHEANSKAKK